MQGGDQRVGLPFPWFGYCVIKDGSWRWVLEIDLGLARST